MDNLLFYGLLLLIVVLVFVIMLWPVKQDTPKVKKKDGVDPTPSGGGPGEDRKDPP